MRIIRNKITAIILAVAFAFNLLPAMAVHANVTSGYDQAGDFEITIPPELLNADITVLEDSYDRILIRIVLDDEEQTVIYFKFVQETVPLSFDSYGFEDLSEDIIPGISVPGGNVSVRSSTGLDRNGQRQDIIETLLQVPGSINKTLSRASIIGDITGLKMLSAITVPMNIINITLEEKLKTALPGAEIGENNLEARLSALIFINALSDLAKVPFGRLYRLARFTDWAENIANFLIGYTVKYIAEVFLAFIGNARNMESAENEEDEEDEENGENEENAAAGGGPFGSWSGITPTEHTAAESVLLHTFTLTEPVRAYLSLAEAVSHNRWGIFGAAFRVEITRIDENNIRRHVALANRRTRGSRGVNLTHVGQIYEIRIEGAFPEVEYRVEVSPG